MGGEEMSLIKNNQRISSGSGGTGRSAGFVLFAITTMLAAQLNAKDPASAKPTTAAPAPSAAVQSSSAGQLDKSIAETVRKPEYSWREPRSISPKNADLPAAELSMLDRFIKSLAGMLEKYGQKMAVWMQKLEDWLKKKFKRDKPNKIHFGEPDWPAWKQSLLFIFYAAAALAAAVIGVYLYRLFRSKRASNIPTTVPVITLSEIPDDGLAASQLPDEEWLKMARDLLEKGELRLALRAMFLASLARLAGTGRLSLARYKSNRDYMRELQRRSHDTPAAINAFGDNIDAIERIWYGSHQPTNDVVDAFKGNLALIFNDKVI